MLLSPLRLVGRKDIPPVKAYLSNVTGHFYRLAWYLFFYEKETMPVCIRMRVKMLIKTVCVCIWSCV